MKCLNKSKLYNLVSAKVGYISPELWHEALTEAKRDIKANRAISAGTWGLILGARASSWSMSVM